MAAIKPKFPATRKFVLRADASIKTGQKQIAKVFGLPLDSIRLVKPGGKRMRSDAKVIALLKAWGWE